MTLTSTLLWFSWIATFVLQVSAENGTFGKGEERIIGGTPAEPNKYPFMIRLDIQTKNGARTLCGASLINSQYALTAGHCIQNKKGDVVESIVAVLGNHNLEEKNDIWTVSIIVEKWFLKAYNYRRMNNDLSLLKLSTPVEFSAGIKPICLPPFGQYYTKGFVRAIGWGATNDEMPRPSEDLLEVDLDVLPDSDCQLIYHDWFHPNSMMCAGYLDGNKDTCVGDSGGPIFIYDDNNVATLIGMTSFAFDNCGRPGLLAVYTRLATFTNWVVGKAATGGPICFGTFKNAE